MTTNRQNFSKYVHEYTNDKGETMFAVGEWDEFHAQWICPMDARERKLTGCYAYFAKNLTGLGGPGYRTRRQALRRARYLYGDQEEEIVKDSLRSISYHRCG